MQILDHMPLSVKGAGEGLIRAVTPNGAEATTVHADVLGENNCLICKAVPLGDQIGQEAKLFCIADLIDALCIGLQGRSGVVVFQKLVGVGNAVGGEGIALCILGQYGGKKYGNGSGCGFAQLDDEDDNDNLISLQCTVGSQDIHGLFPTVYNRFCKIIKAALRAALMCMGWERV